VSAIVDNDAADRVWDAFLSCGNPDGYTRDEAVKVCAESGCACDEGEQGACLRCEALEALGVAGPAPRFRVLESEPVEGGAASYVVEDWLDESDPVPVDPWFEDRAEAQAFADRLNRNEAEKGEP
jgi:hypothetical protein